MITRKHKVVSTTAVWPYTPEPSPPLRPVTLHTPVDLFKMPDDSSRLRPISVVSRREGAMSPSGRPTLEDVLNGRAPAPYTLAAYTAFLSQQHCLETLEFVTEAKKYSTKYDEAAAHFAGMPFTTDSDEGYELTQDWCRLLDIYVKPGAPREINLPAEERDDLVDVAYEPKPPSPEALDPAVKRMYDLMSDSIFIPFCNSLKISSSIPMGSFNPSLVQFESNESLTGNKADRTSKFRHSPPTTSPIQQRANPTSNLTSALARTSSARLSMHMSHSSAASDTAMSDQSSISSPTVAEREITSPPLTPPRSDMPSGTSAPGPGMQPKPHRNDSGGWKKLGSKLFGNKKTR